MTDTATMVGGCMCGAVRYETTGETFGVQHCHCHSCRKHNGGPVVTLAGDKADQVTFSIAWFDIADGLPRYEGFTEGSPVLRHGPVKDGRPSG